MLCRFGRGFCWNCSGRGFSDCFDSVHVMWCGDIIVNRDAHVVRTRLPYLPTSMTSFSRSNQSSRWSSLWHLNSWWKLCKEPQMSQWQGFPVLKQVTKMCAFICFLRANCCRWPSVKWCATIGYCRMCDFGFYFILGFDFFYFNFSELSM